MVVPLFLHGGGVEINNNDSMITYHIGSLVNGEGSFDSGLLLAACPKSCTCKTTWDPIWKSLCDGFYICQIGTTSSGQELAGGWKFVIWQLLGDHDQFSNQYGLPHWANHLYCWECKANKTSATISGFDFSLLLHMIYHKGQWQRKLNKGFQDTPFLQLKASLISTLLRICFIFVLYMVWSTKALGLH